MDLKKKLKTPFDFTELPKKKSVSIFLLLFLVCVVVYIIFSYREVYQTQYDNTYLRDLYDHSQWNIALSKRTMSDNLLYQVTSFDLVHKWHFFSINPEAPVLGKYLYGYSIKIFHNAETVSLILFLLSLGAFYLIIKEFISNNILRFMAVILFASEPLLFSHMSFSLFDLPQLLSLLIHVLSMLRIRKSYIGKKNTLLWLLVAGISLGVFISLKIGFFSTAIIAADVILLISLRRAFFILPIIALTILVYILSFLPYFMQGHSFIDFLKAEKWVFGYWISSNDKAIPGMVYIVLVLGWSKGWFKGAVFDRVKEWTILWPFYFGSFVYLFPKRIKQLKEMTPMTYITLMTGLFLLIFTFIPLFTRYLTLIMPFFIIFFVVLIPRFPRGLLMLLFFIITLNFFTFLNPNPSDNIKSITRTWSSGAYQDVYSFFDTQSKHRFSRQEYWRDMQSFERDLGVESRTVTISAPFTFPWQRSTEGVATVGYQTHLGPIVNTQPLSFVKEANVWKIHWKDSLVLDTFSMDDKIIAEYQPAKMGVLKTQNGTILSEGGEWPYFLVVPQKIKDEQILQKQLTSLTGLTKLELELLYRMNNQPDFPAEIGFLKPSIYPESLFSMDLDPGIVKEMRITHVYNPTLVKKGKLKQLLGTEYSYLSRLAPQVGGSIFIDKPTGQKILVISRDKKDGQNFSIDKL